MSNPCPICDKPIADTAYVCHVCVTDLARRLRDSARDWPDLEDAIGRRMILRSRTTGTRKPQPGDELALAHETPLLINPAAMEQADIITNTATTWARHVIEERGHAAPTGRTPTQAALTYLADNLGWLAHRPEAEEAFDELHCIRRDMEAAIDNPPPMRFVGPCGVCDRELYSRIGAIEVTCEPCDLTYNVEDRLADLMEQMKDHLDRPGVIAAALRSITKRDVRREHIGSWAQRNLIMVKGRDRDGRPLYRIGDVLEVYDKQQERHAARHAKSTA